MKLDPCAFLFSLSVSLAAGEITQLSFNNDKGNHLFSERTVGSIRLEMKNELRWKRRDQYRTALACKFIVMSGDAAPWKSWENESKKRIRLIQFSFYFKKRGYNIFQLQYRGLLIHAYKSGNFPNILHMCNDFTLQVGPFLLFLLC